jgi:hypothetical protein
LVVVVVVVVVVVLLLLLLSEARPRLRLNPLSHPLTTNLDRRVRSSNPLRARKIRRSTYWRPK